MRPRNLKQGARTNRQECTQVRLVGVFGSKFRQVFKPFPRDFGNGGVYGARTPMAAFQLIALFQLLVKVAIRLKSEVAVFHLLGYFHLPDENA